jgi:hypothetical protein
MAFWTMVEQFLSIFLTLAVLGVILTHSGEFVSLVNQTGQTARSLFQSMTFQQ